MHHLSRRARRPGAGQSTALHAGPAVMQIVGNAATLKEAQQELDENWRRWLAWAALAPDDQDLAER
jgi:hypothetical protein